MATVTTSQLAREFGIEERVVRVFLREITPQEKRPGLGRKWEVKSTPASMRRLKRQYEMWSESHKRLIERHAISA